MSRTRHHRDRRVRFWWDYAGDMAEDAMQMFEARRGRALTRRELDLDVDEYDDVPDGDYVRTAALHEAQARSVHHRGRRRRAQARRREKWLRASRRLREIRGNVIVGRYGKWVFDPVDMTIDLERSDRDPCKKR